jgi:hypothetical protein
MLEFYKNNDIRETLKSIISDRQLISSLFRSVPELNSIGFSVTNEYDDSNYYDSVRLESVNGYSWSPYEDCYDDELEDYYGVSNNPDGKKLDKEVVNACASLIEEVGKDFGYGDENSLLRSDYTSPSYTTKPNREFNRFILDLAAGNKLKDESILAKIASKFGSKWALYYAFDHGRLSKETEDKIFLKKGNMREPYLYSVHVLKDVLPKNIEDFHILNCFGKKKESSDQEYLNKYLEFKKTLVVE